MFHTNQQTGEITWTASRCSSPGCFIKFDSIGFYLGTNGEEICKTHAKESILQYKKSLYPNSPSLNKPSGNPFANQKRLSGVLVRYATLPHVDCPSIWTPTRLYPYPNHRRKFGLKGSYSLAEGTVVSWGKHQDPCERKQEVA